MAVNLSAVEEAGMLMLEVLLATLKAIMTEGLDIRFRS